MASCYAEKRFGLKKSLKKGTKCIKCGKPAKVLLPYGPQAFCEEHFCKLIESRYKKTVRLFNLFPAGKKLLFAVSGGKDSLTALYLGKKFFSKRNQIEALLIDEGVRGYREKALRVAEKNCYDWGVHFTRVSFEEEFNITMDKIVKKMSNAKENQGSPCAFCGTLRRALMNKYAKKLGAVRLVTGHNMDDECQSILMNAFDNDLQRFVRSGAITGIKPFNGFVQRVKPLSEIPEREIVLYALFKGYSTYSGECCPYHGIAKRNKFREILNELEDSYPGSKYSLWRFFNSIKPLLLKSTPFGNTKMNACTECGEPTLSIECDACKKLKKLKALKKQRKP